MSKEKQNKLIFFTFLITMFLLSQWFWENVPRYEWKKHIQEYSYVLDSCYYNPKLIDCFCEYVTFIDQEWTDVDCEITSGKCYTRQKTESQKLICYFEEKVRINP